MFDKYEENLIKEILEFYENDPDEFYRTVFILNAGGTINMSGTISRRPFRAVEKLARKISTQVKVPIRVLNLFKRPPDSSCIGTNEWNRIINILNVVIKKKNILEKENNYLNKAGGIVITHGTDTLEETSLVVALESSLRYSYKYPSIIFTCSWTIPDQPCSDALENIIKAIYLASTEYYKTVVTPLHGVVVVVGEDIHLATRISKLRTRPDETGKYIYSYPGPIGKIYGLHKGSFKVTINAKYLLSLLNEKIPLLEQKYNFGTVEHLIVDQKTPLLFFEFLVDRIKYYRRKTLNKRIGVVIQGDFSRNPNFNNIAKILEELHDKMHIPIAIGSRKVFEKLIKIGVPGICLIHKSLTHTKARTKLCWLLKFDIPTHYIGYFLNYNFAGEIFETENLPEWIKYETFPPNNPFEGKIIIKVYPDLDYRVIYDAIIMLLNSNAKRKYLYLIGFGDGHIPVINKSLSEMVSEYLRENYLPCNNNIFQDSDDYFSMLSKLEEMIRTNKSLYVVYAIKKYDIDRYKFVKELVNRLRQEYIAMIIGKIKDVIKNAITHEINHNRMYEIPDNIVRFFMKNYISQYELSHFIAKKVHTLFGISIKNKEESIKKLIQELSNKFNQSNSAKIYYKILELYPDLLAKRILKDAVMNADNRLKYLGVATDLGIIVKIKTSAYLSRTNTLLYEVGNFLYVVGVDSDEAKGLDQVFIPKNTIIRVKR